MLFKETEKNIERFLREIKLTWQVIFLVSIVLYGLSFLHHLSTRESPRPLPYFTTIDLISFAFALGLAIFIFREKRKYFSLRALRVYLEKLAITYPESDEKKLAQLVVNNLKTPIRIIWLMGGIIVLLGVIFYWWTFTTKNMNIYFIVGVYSLMMNYPRKDLFMDLPYLIAEVLKGRIHSNRN